MSAVFACICCVWLVRGGVARFSLGGSHRIRCLRVVARGLPLKATLVQQHDLNTHVLAQVLALRSRHLKVLTQPRSNFLL